MVVLIRPDHDCVAVDRHALAEVVTRSAIVRSQLGNLRPAGGEVASRVAREHVRRPAVGSIVVVLIRPDHHRVAVDRHALAEVVSPSAVVRSQIGALQVLDTTAARGLRQSSKSPDGREIGLRACRDREDRPRRDDQRQERQDDERRARPAQMESRRRRPTAAGT